MRKAPRVEYGRRRAPAQRVHTPGGTRAVLCPASQRAPWTPHTSQQAAPIPLLHEQDHLASEGARWNFRSTGLLGANSRLAKLQ